MISRAQIEDPQTSISATVVNQALALILESHPFKTSKQCSDLLQYIVNRSLKGDDASLRERIIGIEVFGRKPDYDSSEDPVVRIRAADVRKRLAQYYQSLPRETDCLRIELQPGSYRAHFRLDPPTSVTGRQVESLAGPPLQLPTLQSPAVSPVAAGKESSLGRASGKWFAVATILFLLGIGGFVGWIVLQKPSPQRQFWAPVADNKQSILLYVGSNAVYQLTEHYVAKYQASRGTSNADAGFFIDIPPDISVQRNDFAPVHDTFVTTGDLAAVVQLVSLMNEWKQPFVLRSGRDLSIGDLRDRPTVTIGAFNNPWTLELTKDLPYAFRDGNRVQSRDHTEINWIVHNFGNSATEDYAVISRLLTSKSGGPLITVAGIGQYGTQGAGEFLANPDKMRDLLKSAPKGWEKKNMQAVLHVKVVGSAPVSVEVIATSYW